MYPDVEYPVKSPDRKCLRRNPSNIHSDSRNTITQNRVFFKPNRFEKISYFTQKLIDHRNTVIILIIRPDNHEVINTLVNEFLILDILIMYQYWYLIRIEQITILIPSVHIYRLRIISYGTVKKALSNSSTRIDVNCISFIRPVPWIPGLNHQKSLEN